MKKRLFAVLLAAGLAVGGGMALSACDNNGGQSGTDDDGKIVIETAEQFAAVKSDKITEEQWNAAFEIENFGDNYKITAHEYEKSQDREITTDLYYMRAGDLLHVYSVDSIDRKENKYCDCSVDGVGTKYYTQNGEGWDFSIDEDEDGSIKNIIIEEEVLAMGVGEGGLFDYSKYSYSDEKSGYTASITMEEGEDYVLLVKFVSGKVAGYEIDYKSVRYGHTLHNAYFSYGGLTVEIPEEAKQAEKSE